MIDSDEKAPLLEAVWEHYGGAILPGGTQWRKAKCPFHDDVHPSAQVNLTQGIFNCFSCGRTGDVFNLAMLQEGCDFAEAKEKVATISGTSLDGLNATSSTKRKRKGYRPPWLSTSSD